MNFFREVQKNFEILGVCSKRSRINAKSLGTCLIYGLGTSSSAIFLFYEADSLQEYTNNFYITSSSAVAFIIFPIMIFKTNKLFALIDNIEKLIDKSE